MRFDIVTLFPGFFEGPLRFGVLERALRQDRLEVHLHDLRAFTHDRHRTVDDRPFGGGEGMVLKPEPLFACVESLGVSEKSARSAQRQSVVLLSAAGTRFTQQTAQQLAWLEHVTLICGRYEGVDERVSQLMCDRELSIGDYVLSGGELAAMVIVDAVARLLPGVLGHADSSRYESFSILSSSDDMPPSAAQPPRSTQDSGGLLDYPHFTRPAVFRGSAVPQPLLGGNHEEVRRWRRRAALERTRRNRPDLLKDAPLSPDDRQVLAELEQEWPAE